MLTLSYNTRERGPEYHFDITSDHPFNYNIESVHAIAFKRGIFHERPLAIAFETLLDSRILPGEMICRETEQCYLDCTIILKEFEPGSERNNIIKGDQSLTICVITGALARNSVLPVIAQFDVELNYDGLYADAVSVKHFDIATGQVAERNPVIILPRRPNVVRVYQNCIRNSLLSKRCSEEDNEDKRDMTEANYLINGRLDVEEIRLPPKK